MGDTEGEGLGDTEGDEPDPLGPPPLLPPPALPDVVSVSGHEEAAPPDWNEVMKHWMLCPKTSFSVAPMPRHSTPPMSATRSPYSTLAAPRDARRRGRARPVSPRRARTETSSRSRTT